VKLRLLTRADVQQTVSMAQAIEAVKGAFAQLSSGRVDVPLRTQMFVPELDAVTLVMPAHLSESGSMAIKVVSVFPDNPRLGLPTTQGVLLVVDPRTGSPVAVMDATYLTALRTGAATGVATDLLARKDARSVAIFGAGNQGRTQLLGVCEVRNIQRVWVYDQYPERTQQFVAELRKAGGRVPVDVSVAASSQEAVAEADVICTATTSRTALFKDADLKPGVHTNAIGAHTIEMQEVDEATVARARIVVDSRVAAMAEAGDLVIPMRKGLITEQSIHAELGEIILGRKPGRANEREVTLFKSVGNAVEDAAVARLALQAAEERGLGTEVEL
jgi:ornithine cyclodeaminase